MEKENIDSLDNTAVQPSTSIRKELTERDGYEEFNDTIVKDSYSCAKISDSDASNAQPFLEKEHEANLFNNEGCSSECNPIILSVRGNVTDEEFNSLNDEIDMDVLDKEDNLPVKRDDKTPGEKMVSDCAAAMTSVSSMPATSVLQSIISKVCSTKSSISLLATSNPKVSTGSGTSAVTVIKTIKRPNILKVGHTSAPSRLRIILPASTSISNLKTTSSNTLKDSTVDITNNLPTVLDGDSNTAIFNSTTQLDEAYYSSVVDRIFFHASWDEGMTRQEVLKDASPSLILPQKAQRENVDKQFVCSVCNHEFYLEGYLNSHMERKVFVLAYYCKKCRRHLTFYNKCTLWQHLRQEYPEGFSEENFASENSYFNLKPYLHVEKSDKILPPLLPRIKIKCKFCSKNFLSAEEERMHMTRLDSLPLLSCHQCLKLIGNSCALSAHLTIHKANSQDVVCPECAVTIKRSDGLKGVFDHLDSCHHFNIGYVVSCQCGKACISMSAVKIHMLKCHTKLLLRCHICHSCFSSLDLLSKHCKGSHKTSPLPSKVVLCVMCSNGFETHLKLKAHIEKHTNGIIAARKRFFCFLCKKDFSCSSILQIHIEKDHSHRPKRCTICFGLFESRQSLVQHIMSKSCSPENLPVKLDECLDMIVKQDEVIDVNFYKQFFRIPTSKSPSVTAATDKNANVLDKSKPSGVTNVSKNSSGQSNTPNVKISSGQSFTNTPNLSVCVPAPVQIVEKRKYQCHSCKICLVGSQNYSQHMALHCSKGLVRNHTNCGICRKTIDDTLIESHMKSHQQRGIIVCAFCHSRNFASMNDALQHIKNLCNYKTVENDGATYVKGNEAENVDESDVSCEVIEEERESNQGGQTASEITSHEESSVFPCLMCGLAFSSKQAKEDHVTRVHDGTRTIYLCLLCEKKGIRKCFSKKNVMDKHISHKHRILNPGDIADLIRVEEQNVTSGHVVPTELHQLVRDSPAPKRLRLATEDDFLCGKCGLSTGDSKMFAEHIVVHNPKKEPQCPECGLCFTVLTTLKKHLFIVHKIKEMNDYLEKRGLLEAEVEEEEERGVDCADVLIVDSYVTSHDANTTIVKGTTRYCGVRSKSSSGNIHECNVCYRKFPIEALLKTHMRTHGMAFIRSKRFDKNSM